MDIDFKEMADTILHSKSDPLASNWRSFEGDKNAGEPDEMLSYFNNLKEGCNLLIENNPELVDASNSFASLFDAELSPFEEELSPEEEEAMFHIAGREPTPQEWDEINKRIAEL